MDNTLVGMEESAVAVIQRCSVNKHFWKIYRKIPVLRSLFNKDFSLLQNGRTKTWCIRIDKSYCMSEYFPKAKLFVNFLHKLYQKYVKQDVLKHKHHFPPFFLEQIQNVSKKVMFRNFGLFLLFVFPSSFRKRFPFIKKAGYNVKVHETLISKWGCLYFYLKPFRSQAYSCKISENRKNGASCGPKLQKYCVA